MKKIILALICFLYFEPVSAKNNINLIKEISEVPITLNHDGIEETIYFNEIRNKENEVIYLVEPTKEIKTNISFPIVEKNQLDYIDISLDKWEEIVMIAHYGFGYDDHTEEKWLAITQYLIWKCLMPEGWSINIENDIHKANALEIEQLVNDFFNTLPSFFNDEINVFKNNNLELSDTNNVLQYYNVENNDYIIDKNNNKINMVFPQNSKYIINLKRNEFKDTVLYSSGTFQDYISSTGVIAKEISFNVNVTSGTLKLNILNGSGNTKFQLKDSLNNIYEINNLNKANILTLPVGEVQIRNLNNNSIYHTIINNNEETIFDITDELIISDLDNNSDELIISNPDDNSDDEKSLISYNSKNSNLIPDNPSTLDNFKLNIIILSLTLVLIIIYLKKMQKTL